MVHEDAVDLIQHFEACSRVAFACPAHVSRGGQWPYLTIGYGHTGPDVQEGQRITTSQARELLARDLANVEHIVRDKVRVKLSDEALGALCSLAMNLKPGLFMRLPMLLDINAGEFGTFEEEDCYTDPIGPRVTGMARDWAGLRKYVSGNESAISPVLMKRRICELQMFFFGEWSVPLDDRTPQMVDEGRTTSTLHPGMRGDIIGSLHDALAAAGYPVTCGDAYTWVTAEAVKSFQAANGLEMTGVYDAQTAAMLERVVNGAAR